MKRILIVDDSETVRQQVRQALAPDEYDVVEARDGAEGLARIRQGSDLDLVLCDVNMPNMTGLEMLDRLRVEAQKPPIVMLTSEGQPSFIRRARDAGAKAWIVKPFKVELLLAAIKKLTAAARAA